MYQALVTVKSSVTDQKRVLVGQSSKGTNQAQIDALRQRDAEVDVVVSTVYQYVTQLGVFDQKLTAST
ncbi:hypothetical protein [Vibrio phage YC]|uniref:Uncharacterized protein n=1 Tax=Vibrio phage YC TaxID=2267403 RepID=A0A384ZS48_9CAUD|nr:hypothetical protein HWB64_gp091 [Vibrio phage YC]AXC34460.1 hypothetical protein [Vibrio phage YC]